MNKSLCSCANGPATALLYTDIQSLRASYSGNCSYGDSSLRIALAYSWPARGDRVIVALLKCLTGIPKNVEIISYFVNKFTIFKNELCLGGNSTAQIRSYSFPPPVKLETVMLSSIPNFFVVCQISNWLTKLFIRLTSIHLPEVDDGHGHGFVQII